MKENLDFQKTGADQTATIEALHNVLDRLATFYDKESLLQSHGQQTPPVPSQMVYKTNAGSTGVMLHDREAHLRSELSAAINNAQSEDVLTQTFAKATNGTSHDSLGNFRRSRGFMVEVYVETGTCVAHGLLISKEKASDDEFNKRI